MKFNRKQLSVNDSFVRLLTLFLLLCASGLLIVLSFQAAPIRPLPLFLGNYPDTFIPLSGNATVSPDSPPTNTTSINVSTSTSFQGTFEGNPTNGVVRVTDARPAGTYSITVRAFNGTTLTDTKTFTLTVTTPATCSLLNFTTTTYFVAGGPWSVAVGDFNGDSKQDLVTANGFANNVTVLVGDGMGAFGLATSFSTGVRPFSVVVGDFNGDGKQDIAAANQGSDNVSVLLGDGTGHFAPVVNFGAGSFPRSVAVGDFNGDGKQDLVTANNGSDNVSILLGDGAGHFSAAVNYAVGDQPFSVVVGDFNGDGKQDIVVANQGSDNVSVLLGDGTGNFSPAATFLVDVQPWSITVGDFNNDNKQDLAVANGSFNCTGNVSILIGDGAGNFNGPTTFGAGPGPDGIAIGDFNGDGKQDLGVCNACTDPSLVSILLGNNAGQFSPPTNFFVSIHPLGLAVGDFNRDGLQDIAVATYITNDVSILLRRCVPTSPTPSPTSSQTPTPTSTATPTATATAISSVTPSPTPTPTPPTIIVTTTSDNGTGSLRQAIADAKDGDVIGFDPALNGQNINLTSGELSIDKNIGIAGPGPALLRVSRSLGMIRIFHIMPGHTVSISGLTIQNGLAPGGGGVLNDHATLTIDNCDLFGNTAGDGHGGGISNDGSGSSATLTILNTTIRSNSASSTQALVAGGGVANDASSNGSATLHIDGSLITNNEADFSNQQGTFQGDGGGIYNNGAGAILTISNTTVSNNRAGVNKAPFPVPSGGHGGGIWSSGSVMIINSTINSNHSSEGGGISNDGPLTLTLINSVVTGNLAESSATLSGNLFTNGEGGGIYNDGILSISNSTVSGNAAGYTSGSYNQGGGGGIWNEGAATVGNSRITSNHAGYGGGISNSGTSLTVSGSSIDNNTARVTNGVTSGDGGGIKTVNSVTITDSTLRNNSAAGDGGALHGPGTITNTTISSNMAGLSGGGIKGGAIITNSTISGNSAANAGGIDANGAAITHSTIAGNSGDPVGGILVVGIVEIGNTILKTGGTGSNMNNSGGTVTSHGYNISNDDGAGRLTGPGDQINTDPLLGPLQNNGGPTSTHELLAGSPAINAGDPNFTPPPLYDQRGPGFVRVYNERLDIGSFELQTLPPTPTPTPTPSPSSTPSPSQLANISTRLHVGTGDDVGIGGFIITGKSSLQVVIRAIGPSLGAVGVPDPLIDPILEVRDSTGALLLQNDNWQDNEPQAKYLEKLGLAPTQPAESGLIIALPPGAYTATVLGKNNGTGTGLVEVYNVDESVPPNNIELANISTRGVVQIGENVMIGGFILTGGTNNNGIAIRGIGPSLTQFGINNALSDPTLELRDNNGALIIMNDNWQDDPASAAELTAHGLAPQNTLESGIFVTLQPNTYTAILAGKDGGVGVGLVEIYNLN